MKVWFALEQDEDGWPPASTESMWAEPVGDGTYRLDNTPWFVREVASGDVVRAVRDEDGVLWATEHAELSERMTVRVVPFSAGPLGGDLSRVLAAFEPLGVTGEGIEQYGIVALDIPADADLVPIQRLLVDGQADGRWDYEEACVNAEWLALPAPAKE